MNVGIIAEYNPFHKGHRLHISNTLALTGAKNIIAVMSGSFVQRGEPAIADKFIRTRAALLNGVDMVLELPVTYATGAADVFAFGAVDTLNKSGMIDIVSFGTEAGDIDLFKEAAKLLNNETPEFKASLHRRLKKGISYAAAREGALSEILSRDMSFLAKSNNILALEYLRSLDRLKSSIIPVTIRREVSSYNSDEMTGEISSAKAIRHSLYNGETDIALSAIPSNCYSMINTILENPLPHIDRYTDALKYILRTEDSHELALIDGITEGLENRIPSITAFKSITELTDAVKSKRYTHSRVRRALLHILLDIKKTDIDMTDGVKYIRVLGFKRNKAELVSQLTEKSRVPVITNVKNAPEGLYDKELFATNMYYMPLSGAVNKDFTEPLVIV